MPTSVKKGLQMNAGYIRSSLLSACVSGALLAVTGCYQSWDRNGLSSEGLISLEHPASAYAVPAMNGPFTSVDAHLEESTEWPVAAEESSPVAKFIFPRRGSHWQAGDFQVGFDFEDPRRRSLALFSVGDVTR